MNNLKNLNERSWTLDEDVLLWMYDRSSVVNALPDLISLLSREEREQAAAMASRARADTFMAARILLRLRLSEHLGVPPEALEFSTDAKGKPCLASAKTSLGFNLSHSHEGILLATIENGKIGVDLEYLDGGLNFPLFARHLFSFDEQEALARMNEPERRIRILESWCRKEARLKCGAAEEEEGSLHTHCGLAGTGYVYAAAFSKMV